MTPRGLIKLTAIANNLEAWHDWRQTADQARALGLADLVEKLQPQNDAGWRRVDKARHLLLGQIGKVQR